MNRLLKTVQIVSFSFSCFVGIHTIAQQAQPPLEAACTSEFYDGTIIRNFGVFGPSAWEDNREWYESYYTAPQNREEALERLSLALGTYGRDVNAESCAERALQYLTQNKVNLYVYFHGFGQHVQENTIIDVPNIFKWINARDPNALIISISWNCGSATNAGHNFCQRKGQEFNYGENHPVYKSYEKATGLFARVQKEQGNFEILKTQSFDYIDKYNATFSHSMEVAAKLVDHALMADMGDIHFVGYSMGAQSAAEILVTDFLMDSPANGYQWSKDEVCENGGNTCIVSELKKVKWSLSLGLPGWTYALRETYNHFDPVSGLFPARLKERREKYSNGGLIRIQSLEGDVKNYNNKLNIFNKRKDPTSDADDAIERGMQGSYAEYNHYGHDYDRPLFKNAGFVKTLDRFIRAESPRDNLEFGIAWDVGSYFEFEDCTEEICNPRNYYTGHQGPRSHSGWNELSSTRSVLVSNDGVPHSDNSINKAVDFSQNNSSVLSTWTTDQEDLRGGVEFYYKAKTEQNDGELKGLFSYGDCSSSSEELMPEAFIENDTLTFRMKYRANSANDLIQTPQLETYQVTIPRLSERPEFQQEQWVHLAFNWSLPTPSELLSLAGKSEADILRLTQTPRHARAAATYQLGFVLNAGATKPPPSSFRSQLGQGHMSISVNGQEISRAPLGSPESSRHCLNSREVLGDNSISDANGNFFPAYRPWPGYDIGTDQAPQIGGPICKAFKIRNTTVNFGCAQTNGQVNANALMDDIRLVFGEPRSHYPEVETGSGRPLPWF